MTDLAKFDGLAKAQEDGIPVKILDPAGEDLAITVVVAGPESDRQKKARNRIINDRLNRNRNRKQTAEELDADALKISAAAIISWQGIEISGQPFEYSAANAVELLKRFPFIRDQLDSVIGNRSEFFKEEA